jgi:hypothetical protein
VVAAMNAICANCEHWAGKYEPTAFQLEDAPNGSLPVYKESTWGWCTAKERGKWLAWPDHKQKFNAGVETHHDGACESHSSGERQDSSSDSQPSSESTD